MGHHGEVSVTVESHFISITGQTGAREERKQKEIKKMENET